MNVSEAYREVLGFRLMDPLHVWVQNESLLLRASMMPKNSLSITLLATSPPKTNIILVLLSHKIELQVEVRPRDLLAPA